MAEEKGPEVTAAVTETVTSSEDDNKIVNLISQEGDAFAVKLSAVLESGLVKTMIDGNKNLLVST